MKPRLLDLFCKAGGAGQGYAAAGFDVVGVDIVAQPRYPRRFVQADALEYLAEHGREFDAIHASPPCQAYSKTRFMPGRDAIERDDLVAATRDALAANGRPWIIENVPLAPLRNPIMLCGAMFPRLRVYRHRLFEASVPLVAPLHPRHAATIGTGRMASYNKTPGSWVTVAGHLFKLDVASSAMGINWMTRAELAQAIPPAYTAFIGHQLLEQL